VKGKPPASLDRLRALLDAAAVRRVLLPHDSAVVTPEERAAALSLPTAAVAHAQIAEADGDLLAAIIPGDRRLDLAGLAAAVGARRARPAGAEDVRRRFSLDPDQVPLLTGLPTVLDASLLAREFVFGATGDPLWTLRIAPTDLKRATGAIVAAIATTGHRRSAGGPP
jgi:Cys-tRNA(Pro)/Cys-tRNA(Cys) deacylase